MFPMNWLEIKYMKNEWSFQEDSCSVIIIVVLSTGNQSVKGGLIKHDEVTEKKKQIPNKNEWNKR